MKILVKVAELRSGSFVLHTDHKTDHVLLNPAHIISVEKFGEHCLIRCAGENVPIYLAEHSLDAILALEEAALKHQQATIQEYTRLLRQMTGLPDLESPQPPKPEPEN